jgi:hypothetical protein
MNLTPQQILANSERSDRANEALKKYGKLVGEDHFADECLTDLLCDLMHWCDRHQTEFDNCLRVGRMHYEAEVSGHD